MPGTRPDSKRFLWSFGDGRRPRDGVREEVPLPKPGDQIGPYLIEQRLGSGGMGAVYAARHVELNAVHALKVLIPPAHLVDAPAREARFLREAQLLAAIPPHAGLVRVHTFGVSPEGVGYCVQELVLGRDLQQVLSAETLSVERAVRVVSGLAEALAHAHRGGIVHRDVKPANVLLRERDGSPVLVDFGLARSLAPAARLTKTGAMLGTFGYMAPEQIAGGRVGPAADVFALGVVLYEALTGELPFPTTSMTEYAGAVVKMDPAPASSKRDDAPPALDRMIEAALAKDPAERPSADALAAALNALLAGEEVALAGLNPRYDRLRRRLVWVAAGVWLLAGVVVLGVSAVNAIRRSRLEARAQSEQAARAEALIRDLVRLSGQRLFGLPPEADGLSRAEALLAEGGEAEWVESLTRARALYEAADAFARGDLERAAHLAERLEGDDQARLRLALAVARDPRSSLDLLRERQRSTSGRAKAESQLLEARARVALGELRRAELALGRVDAPELASVQRALSAEVPVARARAAVAGRREREALRELIAARGHDEAVAAKAGAEIAAAAVASADGQHALWLLDLLDGIADLFGLAALPKDAVALYAAGSEDPKLGVDRRVQLGERVQRLDPSATLSLTAAQYATVQALEALAKGDTQGALARCEYMARGGSSWLAVFWLQLESNYKELLLDGALDRFVAEGRGKGWGPRFIRGQFATSVVASVEHPMLSWKKRPPSAAVRAQVPELARVAAEDFDIVLAEPWLPLYVRSSARMQRGVLQARAGADPGTCLAAWPEDPNPSVTALVRGLYLRLAGRYEAATAAARAALEAGRRRVLEAEQGRIPPGGMVEIEVGTYHRFLFLCLVDTRRFNEIAEVRAQAKASGDPIRIRDTTIPLLTFMLTWEQQPDRMESILKGPESLATAVGHDLLSDFLRKSGQREDAAAVLRRGRARFPDHPFYGPGE